MRAPNQHLLCCLIRPPAQCPSSTLHDDIGIQAAQNTGLVVFGGIEVRDNNIVGIAEVNVASRTDGTQTIALARKLTTIGTLDTEDMAVGNEKVMLAVAGGEKGEHPGTDRYLQVVTTA